MVQLGLIKGGILLLDQLWLIQRLSKVLFVPSFFQVFLLVVHAKANAMNLVRTTGIRAHIVHYQLIFGLIWLFINRDDFFVESVVSLFVDGLLEDVLFDGREAVFIGDVHAGVLLGLAGLHEHLDPRLVRRLIVLPRQVRDPRPPPRDRLLVHQRKVHLILLYTHCLVHDLLLLVVLLVGDHLRLRLLLPWLLPIIIGSVGIIVAHCLGFILLACMRFHLLVVGRVSPSFYQTQVFLLHGDSLVETLGLGLSSDELLLVSENHRLDFLVIKVLEFLLSDIPLLLIPPQE